MKFGTSRPPQTDDQFLFYTAVATGSEPAAVFDSEYTVEYWKPTLRQLVPPRMPRFPYIVWALFHFAGIFFNRDYALYLIRLNGQLVHRSVITPGYFRFPFMQPADLQVGDTWTHPRHRGRVLATGALSDILSRQSVGRRVWYIVRNSNAPSIRVVEKAGFEYAGAGRRIPRFGFSLFGAYCLTQERVTTQIQEVNSTCL